MAQDDSKDVNRLLEVPFSKLMAPDAINARESGSSRASIQALAVAIRAKGLINPLVVRAADKGKFEVADGRRRFKAMQLLVREKHMQRSDLVPVIVRNEDDAAALETSLMANTEREPMHPVDQYSVFARLAEQGRTVADIASTYGLEPRTVRQRLALGELAPVVRKAWRKGTIDAEAAQAFTIHPDQDVQEAAFARIKKSRQGFNRFTVRRELSSNKVPESQVTKTVVERYVAAGGTFTESLFDDDRFLDDGALVTKLQAAIDAEKIDMARGWLEGKGWAWIAADSELDSLWEWQWDRIKVDQLSDKVTEELDQIDDEAHDAEDDGVAQQLFEKAARIRVEAELELYTPEQRARSGAVISLDGWNGTVNVALGIIRPDQSGAVGADDQDDSGDGVEAEDAEAVHGPGVTADDDAAGDEQGSIISTALLRDITALQTDAARAVIAAGSDGHLSLCVAVAALESNTFESPAKLHITQEAAASRHRDADFAKLLTKLLPLSLDAVLEHFTKLVAESLNLEATSNQAPREFCTALVHALDCDRYLQEMRSGFNWEDYFKRAPRELIVEAMSEMEEAGVTGQIPDAALDWRKSDLAAFASEHGRKCGWLPIELRHPGYDIKAAADVLEAAE